MTAATRNVIQALEKASSSKGGKLQYVMVRISGGKVKHTLAHANVYDSSVALRDEAL